MYFGLFYSFLGALYVRWGLGMTHPVVVFTIVLFVVSLAIPSLIRLRLNRKRERLLNQYEQILALAEQQQVRALEAFGASDAP